MPVTATGLELGHLTDKTGNPVNAHLEEDHGPRAPAYRAGRTDEVPNLQAVVFLSPRSSSLTPRLRQHRLRHLADHRIRRIINVATVEFH
ncbi:MAG: hypothetical protein OXC05_15715, partial [Halieaceae bacterium]|nr:hypothetical protein [Halieaceae bacterium]